MGWLIALGIIVLLAVLPLGVSVRYDEDGVLLRLIIGPLKITLFPRPKKTKKPKKEKKKEDKKTEEPPQAEKQSEPAQKTEPLPKPEQQETVKEEAPKPAPAEEEKAEPIPESLIPDDPKAKEEKKKSGGPITDFLPLVGTVLDMLNAFRRKFRVDVLELKLVLGGGDPAALGINYGRTWAAIGNLQPYLERFLVIKKRKIEVECDFLASQTLVTARLDLTITLGRIIGTVVFYGVKALIQFLKINKKRKGGAAK